MHVAVCAPHSFKYEYEICRHTLFFNLNWFYCLPGGRTRASICERMIAPTDADNAHNSLSGGDTSFVVRRWFKLYLKKVTYFVQSVNYSQNPVIAHVYLIWNDFISLGISNVTEICH